ncbi:MAG: DMT family transporter [Kiloniellaceae bacterium]
MNVYLRIVLVMFLWAVCFPLITIGIEFAPHITFAAIRALISGGALLAMALLLGRKLPRSRKDWLALTVIGVGATTLAFFGMFHAAEFVSPGIATVIANTQPLLAALLAHWFLGERLGIHGRLGLALGFAGIVLIAVPQISEGGGEAFRIGVTYIVISAIGISASNVVIKGIATKIDPLMAMGWQLVIGSIPLALIAFVTEDPSAIRWTGAFLGSLIALSLAGTAVAYWVWCTVLQSVALSRANAFAFLVPLFGLGMGAAFYGERLTALALAGIAVTLLGIFLVTKSGIRSTADNGKSR